MPLITPPSSANCEGLVMWALAAIVADRGLMP